MGTSSVTTRRGGNIQDDFLIIYFRCLFIFPKAYLVQNQPLYGTLQRVENSAFYQRNYVLPVLPKPLFALKVLSNS